MVKERLNKNTLKRDLGLFSATILVIANMIGTGIFTTSGFIIQELGNPQTMLFCWFIGGIFALSGALCYGELGAMFPRAGGEYTFLRESYGKGMAFLSGWISLIVGFSAPVAAASIAFATYLFSTIPVPDWMEITISLFGINLFTISSVNITAFSIIIIFSLIHYHSLFLGSRIQNILTIFKITLICSFIAAGLLFGMGSTDNFSGSLNMSTIISGQFAISLIFISFAYSGWNAAVYLGSEIKNPGKNIPLSLFGGTLVVIILYVLLNGVYIYALSQEEMRGVIEIGTTAAASLFGENISKYFAGAISICILSTISAMMMSGPRVYYAMSRDGVFFRIFGKVNKIHRTPGYSIFLQGAIAAIMIISASFDKLLLYIGFTLALFAMMTVTGLVVLRIKEPYLNRPYKTIGYPVTPLLFILGNLWIIYFSIKTRPVVSIFGMVTIGLGILFFLYFNKRNKGMVTGCIHNY